MLPCSRPHLQVVLLDKPHDLAHLVRFRVRTVTLQVHHWQFWPSGVSEHQVRAFLPSEHISDRLNKPTKVPKRTLAGFRRACSRTCATDRAIWTMVPYTVPSASRFGSSNSFTLSTHRPGGADSGQPRCCGSVHYGRGTVRWPSGGTQSSAAVQPRKVNPNGIADLDDRELTGFRATAAWSEG